MNDQQSLIKSSWLKVFFSVCITLFLTIFTLVGLQLYDIFYRPMIVKPHQPLILSLDKSMTAAAFVHQLGKQNLIRHERTFLFLLRLQGFAPQLKAGVYQVKDGESAEQFLYRVIAGDVLIESFRIIEGMTQEQVSAHLATAPYLTYQRSDWTIIAGHLSNAEGLLLADTYHYNAGSGSRKLLEQAHANLQQILEESWQHRSADLPYNTPYELLIVASILEKEAAIPQEKRLISGIIVNRLRKKMPLQMDPTVIYALGSKYTGKLTHEDLHVDSPYNSYLYRGLPPTPIAMVGKDAIDAAAHPAMTNYLYFVAKGDGSHCFSVSYDEQRQAINHYQKK